MNFFSCFFRFQKKMSKDYINFGSDFKIKMPKLSENIDINSAIAHPIWPCNKLLSVLIYKAWTESQQSSTSKRSKIESKSNFEIKSLFEEQSLVCFGCDSYLHCKCYHTYVSTPYFTNIQQFLFISARFP